MGLHLRNEWIARVFWICMHEHKKNANTSTAGPVESFRPHKSCTL